MLGLDDPFFGSTSAILKQHLRRTRSAHCFKKALRIQNLATVFVDLVDDVPIHCFAAPRRRDLSPYSRIRMASAVAKVGFSFG